MDFPKLFFVFFLKSSMINTNKNLRHWVRLKNSCGQANTATHRPGAMKLGPTEYKVCVLVGGGGGRL